jgi:hypothetical protein
VLLGLLTPGFARPARAQTGDKQTFTISGSVGVAGVRMQGLPGNVVTDENGAYSVQVPGGWTGTVKPSKRGYAFEPPAREYELIQKNYADEDFIVKVVTLAISGKVGEADVIMRGLPGDPKTDHYGVYRAKVDYDWSGTVTPMKEGYCFKPPSREYVQVLQEQENQDYQAVRLTFTISGNVGLPGVKIEGFPIEVVSDVNGGYQVQVAYGWSGKVSPRRPGYTFEPAHRQYSPKITEDLSQQDYTPRVVTYTISNVIKAGREPVPGVKVTAQPGGYTAVTDSQGRYSLKVPYGWTGTLEFSKPGVDFVAEVSYFNVTADVIDEKSALPEGEWPSYPSGPSQGGAVAAGDVLVVLTREFAPEKIAETTEDLRVMLQILREKLSEPRMIRGVLRDYGNLLGEDRRAEAIYLEGSAALFVIGADFPPSSAAQQSGGGESQARPQGEAADPVWQRARQKLHSPAGVGSAGQSAQIQAMTFDQFKEELLRSLKHAANIRNVDPNELVVLTIVAQKGDASRTADADMMRQYHNIYGNDDYMATLGLGRPARSTTVLTMQAKKSDIDAFAQGALDFDQFRRKVKSFTY